jgi:predicted O-methyltransferase YrrM
MIANLEQYAKDNNVPIVTKEGLELIKLIIKLKNCKKILEVGTAIGYCSINMALISDDITIETIERKDNMYEQAVKNVANANLENRISVFKADALEMDLSLLREEYDLIFIDAAKAQYRRFFEKYSPLLKANGVIVSDNLLFHGLVESEFIEGKDLRALIRKIKNYNTWLFENDDFDTTFLRIGDGMAISIKKG